MPPRQRPPRRHQPVLVDRAVRREPTDAFRGAGFARFDVSKTIRNPVARIKGVFSARPERGVCSVRRRLNGAVLGRGAGNRAAGASLPPSMGCRARCGGRQRTVRTAVRSGYSRSTQRPLKGDRRRCVPPSGWMLTVPGPLGSGCLGLQRGLQVGLQKGEAVAELLLLFRCKPAQHLGAGSENDCHNVFD